MTFFRSRAGWILVSIYAVAVALAIRMAWPCITGDVEEPFYCLSPFALAVYLVTLPSSMLLSFARSGTAPVLGALWWSDIVLNAVFLYLLGYMVARVMARARSKTSRR